MLYKLEENDGLVTDLTPLGFESLPLEKHLEDLLAKRLLTGLFEGNDLMPIFQERSFQEEADIYALNRHGDLVIFELKREDANREAVYQALRYCETAAHWTYEQLQAMLSKYLQKDSIELWEEHRAAFNLDSPLERSAFNTRQRLIIVGSAGSADLIRNIDYWKSRGLPVEFIPYRIYRIGEARYFEFFSIPYDTHANPKFQKGVLFDTCRTYIPGSIWYMCENERVAAFGDQMHVVNYLSPYDTVFLYHKGEGIVAAGQVQPGSVRNDVPEDALYRKLKWLTPVPRRGVPYNALSPGEISSTLGYGFFWARTIKVPYLNSDESAKLLEALRRKLTGS